MTRNSRKIISALLALLMMLSTLPGSATANTDNELVEISLDGTQNFTMASQVLAIINEERAAEGLSPLTADPVLMDHAMQRAAEAYLYYSHTRPNGSDFWTVLGQEHGFGSFGENIAIGHTSAEMVMEGWMNSPGHRANILKESYNSVGIGCFYQPDGSIAWVQLFHSDVCQNPESRTGITEVTDVRITALASNLVGHVQHHTFGDDTCAAYLYEGSTISTDFCLVNPMVAWFQPVKINSDDYTYISSNSDVLTVDNESHTLTATGVGTAQLSLKLDGIDIRIADDSGYINASATVEVMPMPKLSYEIDRQGNIHVDYSGFNSVATLFYIGSRDELWTMANRTADGIFIHYFPDPNETYVYVMQYWDPYLEMYVELGDRLIVTPSQEDLPVCTHEHTTVLESVAPTCTEYGLTEGLICADCNEILTEQEAISPLGHQWCEWYEVYPPMFGYPGMDRRDCERCGASETRDTEGEHTHSYSVEVTQPTCTEDGSLVYLCECGDTYTEILPKLGHVFIDGVCPQCGALEALPGDVNGDGNVNSRDVRLLLRYLAGLAGEEDLNLDVANFNNDGSINVRDARALLRSIAGLD